MVQVIIANNSKLQSNSNTVDSNWAKPKCLETCLKLHWGSSSMQYILTLIGARRALGHQWCNTTPNLILLAMHYGLLAIENFLFCLARIISKFVSMVAWANRMDCGLVMISNVTQTWEKISLTWRSIVPITHRATRMHPQKVHDLRGFSKPALYLWG